MSTETGAIEKERGPHPTHGLNHITGGWENCSNITKAWINQVGGGLLSRLADKYRVQKDEKQECLPGGGGGGR